MLHWYWIHPLKRTFPSFYMPSWISSKLQELGKSRHFMLRSKFEKCVSLIRACRIRNRTARHSWRFEIIDNFGLYFKFPSKMDDILIGILFPFVLWIRAWMIRFLFIWHADAISFIFSIVYFYLLTWEVLNLKVFLPSFKSNDFDAVALKFILTLYFMRES